MHIKFSLFVVLTAIGLSGFAQENSNTDTEVLNQRMEDAQARLEAAAEEIAKLSRQMSHGDAMAIVKRFSPHGERPMMGIKIDTDDEGRGVLVRGVVEDGPAEAAGMRAGDIIVRINGKALGRDVEAMDALMIQLKSMKAGDTLDVVVDRQGVLENLRVILETAKNTLPKFEKHYFDGNAFKGKKFGYLLDELSDADLRFDMDEESLKDLALLPEMLQQQFAGKDGLSFVTLLSKNAGIVPGFKMAEVGEELGAYFGVDSGVLVTTLPSDTATGLTTGLKVGDVIVAVNDQPAVSIGDVHKAFATAKPGESLVFDVVRHRQALSVDVQVPESISDDWSCTLSEDGNEKRCIRRDDKSFSYRFSDDED